MTTRYASPVAFRQALDQRIRDHALRASIDMGRFRQLLVFDRFLARLVQVFGSRVLLKDGVVLELRLSKARTTKDVDLRLVGNTSLLLDELQEAGRLELGDFLSFLVTRDPHHPTIQGEGVEYEGQRFQVKGMMGGRPYGSPSVWMWAWPTWCCNPLRRSRGHPSWRLQGCCRRNCRSTRGRRTSPRSSMPTPCRGPGRTRG